MVESTNGLPLLLARAYPTDSFPVIKQGTHGLIVIDPADRIRNQRRNRQDSQLVELLFGPNGNRVQHHNLRDTTVLKICCRVEAEHGMRTTGPNLSRSAFNQGGRTIDNRATGIDHVIDHHAAHASKISDNFHHFR